MSIFGTPQFATGSGSGAAASTGSTLNTALGDLLVVCVASFNSQPASVTDTAGNTFVPLSNRNVGGGDFQQFFYCLSASAASATNTFTANFNASSGLDVTIAAYDFPITGGTAAYDTDVTNSGSPDGNTASFNTVGSDEIVISFGYGDPPPNWTQGSGYTLDSAIYGSFSGAQHIAFASPQTAITAGFSGFPSTEATAIAVAFMAAGASGPISANIGGVGSVTASIVSFNLTSSILGVSSVSADLKAPGETSANVAGQATVSGTLLGSGILNASIAGSSSVSAPLMTLRFASANIDGSSSVDATLGGIGILDANIFGRGFLTGQFSTIEISASIEGRSSVVGFLTKPPSRTYFPPNNPMGRQSPPYIIRDFGASTQRPAYVSTSGNALQLFYQPSFVPNVNAGDVLPPTWSTPATPDNQGYQGRVQSPGRIMVAPDNLRLSGKIYKVVAQGMIFVPSSAVNPTFSLQMFQNYFAFGKSAIADSLFSGTPIPLVPGTMNGFTLISTLAGNGVGSGVLSSAGILWVGGQKYFGNGFSNRLQGQEPIVQLSLGMQFGGTISDGELFQAFLSKFQIFNAQF